MLRTVTQPKIPAMPATALRAPAFTPALAGVPAQGPTGQSSFLEQSAEVDALKDRIFDRRTGRVFLGGSIKHGPLTYQSPHPIAPLSHAEQGALLFAACGVTHYAKADMDYGAGPGGKGNVMVRLVGSTVASGDAGQFASFIMMDDEGTYYVRRPQDYSPEEVIALMDDARNLRWDEVREMMLVKIADKRVQIPDMHINQPAFNRNVNEPGTTYFLGLQDLSAFWLTVSFLLFDEAYRAVMRDSNGFMTFPGIKDFVAKKDKRGLFGRLSDFVAKIFQDPAKREAKEALRYLENNILKTYPTQTLANMVAGATEFELGGRVQNIQLMAGPLGLAGRPHFSGNPLIWGALLGFEQHEAPVSTALSVGPLLRLLLKLMGKNDPVAFNHGIKDRDGKWLLRSYSPQAYGGSVRDAVMQFVNDREGPGGPFHPDTPGGPFKDERGVIGRIPRYTERQIEAVIALNEYLFKKYGTWPIGFGPLSVATASLTVGVLDPDFYAKFYKDGSGMTGTQLARSYAALGR